MMCSSPAWTTTSDDHDMILWNDSVVAPKFMVIEDASKGWGIADIPAPPRHIPAFSPTPAPPRCSPNAGRSSFDHVPLDVDKKMFAARRSNFTTGSCKREKIPIASAGAKHKYCVRPPRFINVVSPVEHLHQTHRQHDDSNNIADDGVGGGRMPESTIQVLDSLLMDDDDVFFGEKLS